MCCSGSCLGVAYGVRLSEFNNETRVLALANAEAVAGLRLYRALHICKERVLLDRLCSRSLVVLTLAVGA